MPASSGAGWAAAAARMPGRDPGSPHTLARLGGRTALRDQLVVGPRVAVVRETPHSPPRSTPGRGATRARGRHAHPRRSCSTNGAADAIGDARRCGRCGGHGIDWPSGLGKNWTFTLVQSRAMVQPLRPASAPHAPSETPHVRSARLPGRRPAHPARHHARGAARDRRHADARGPPSRPRCRSSWTPTRAPTARSTAISPAPTRRRGSPPRVTP